jgi:hypothetical protein
VTLPDTHNMGGKPDHVNVSSEFTSTCELAAPVFIYKDSGGATDAYKRNLSEPV